MRRIEKLTPYDNFGSSNPVRLVISTSESKQDLNISKEFSPKDSLILTNSDIKGDCLSKVDILQLRDPNNLHLKLYSGTQNLEKLLLGKKYIIAHGILETLEDFRPILKAIRSHLVNNPDSRLVTYPSKLNYDEKYRSFTEVEIAEILVSCGFVSLGEGRFSASDKSLVSVRKYNNLPESNFTHLLCTAEHPDYRITGGIGSYVKEAKSQYGDESQILLIDYNENLDTTVIRKNKWLSLQNLLSPEYTKRLQENDHGTFDQALLEALYQVIFLYDIKSVEGGDKDHPNLLRVIQAKESGLLPDSLKTITVCHASKLSLANREERYLLPPEIQTSIREMEVVRRSDATIFLTKRLRNFYEENGVTAINPVMRRLPIDLSQFSTNSSTEYKPVRNLIYIGKPTKGKGFDIFLRTALELKAKKVNIQNIYCYGTFTDSGSLEIDNLISRVQRELNYKIIAKNRKDLIEDLTELSGESLAIIPYPDDNHPNVILELMAIGMDFIAANRGGIPEIINPKNSHHFLSEYSVTDFTNNSLKAISDRPEREKLVKINKAWYYEQQSRINSSYTIHNLYRDCHLHNTEKKVYNKSKKDIGADITIIVPCYNTEDRYLLDLVRSINSQSVQPNLVIFINDGSKDKNYSKNLTLQIKDRVNFRFKIIDQENGGLSSARNTGLKAAKTKYVITIDSDDLVTGTYIEDLARSQSMNPGNICTVSYNVMFQDKTDPLVLHRNESQYMPIFQNLSMAFMPSNYFGAAGAIFDRKRLLNLTGGWDSSDKSMWEDWALYLKLTSMGEKIGITPRVNYIYRIRGDSMLRTYSRREGERRLARNFDKVPSFDSYLILSQLKTLWDIYEGKYPKEMWDSIGRYHIEQYINEQKSKSLVRRTVGKAKRIFKN